MEREDALSNPSLKEGPEPGLGHGLSFWRREILAGLAAACAMLPSCMTAGVLVFAPLGPSFVAQGAAVGLYSAVIVGAVYGVLANPSFVIVAPIPSSAIILAAFGESLMSHAEFAGHPGHIVLAIVVCALLAGLLQIVFGLFDVARVIKFTPHSVVVGFKNSVGLLLIVSQLRPFFKVDSSLKSVGIDHPTTLAFIIILAAALVVFGKRVKVPGPLLGLIGGTLCLYGLEFYFPGFDMGRTIGAVPGAFPSSLPIIDIADSSSRAALLSVAPHVLIAALALAAVITLQSLLGYRVAKNLGGLPPQPARDLVAQGLGNCASALAGGIVALTAVVGLNASFRAGGRTRFVGLTMSAVFLLVVTALSPALARIPVAVLSAILMFIGVQLIDHWTFRIFGDALFGRNRDDRRHALQSLLVVALVMIVSVGYSIITGVGAGVALSCVIFIVNMSRPAVRRTYFGNEIFSKHVRSNDDVELLLRTGRERVVLELQGVLFFGNADDLSNLVNDLLKSSKMVLLDMRSVSEVDVSGVNILVELLVRAKSRGKTVLFCNLVPGMLKDSVFKQAVILPDIDSGLEWMEEETLRSSGARSRSEAIAIDALDLTQGLEANELAVLALKVTPRDFKDGEVICREGDDADRMWVLTRGTVSVRLGAERGERRIASLAVGTTVGEMALLDPTPRSATVVADEPVSSYELTRAAFEALLDSHPKIGLKLLKYLTREMAHRLRLSNRDLRKQ